MLYTESFHFVKIYKIWKPKIEKPHQQICKKYILKTYSNKVIKYQYKKCMSLVKVLE